MASTWASPFWTIIAVTRSGCMTANRKPTDAPMSERYSAYEERFSFSMNCSVTVANRSKEYSKSLTDGAELSPYPGSLGQRHDMYPQAWESDCGTYEKTTESRARAERWEHPADRLRDRICPGPPR